ncbi:MAG: hypothetical protein JWO38_772 [Gemmataceae bacterium]|nr:hypothetical protein [Gemmataceae bacterium]
MPTVLDWTPTVDPYELVRPVRESLGAGSPVVLPGDAGYVVLVNPAASHASAQLEALAGIAAVPPAILAYGPDDPAGYGLAVPAAARRLMIRAWPAPLAVALPAAGAVFPLEWPGAVRGRVTADGLVRFRWPDHPAVEAVFPAVFAAVGCVPTLVAETFLPTAGAVVDRLGGAVGVAVSAGDLRTGDRPTVVRVNPDGWEVIQPGAFGVDEVQRLAARILLFVCTGNTCRSPLAEGLAKRLLADRLGCGPEDLPARGIWVLSAGVAAYGGAPASPESADVAAEFGADLRDHRSRPVNPQLLAAADDVVAMTRGHAHALAVRFPGVGPGVRLLCGDDADLDDPIGAGLDVYRECARTILTHLGRFIPEWEGP